VNRPQIGHWLPLNGAPNTHKATILFDTELPILGNREKIFGPFKPDHSQPSPCHQPYFCNGPGKAGKERAAKTFPVGVCSLGYRE
jgi:hypothetical protein